VSILFSFAGYHSSRLYKTFRGTDFRKNTLLTAFLFPGVVFGIFLVLDIAVAAVGQWWPVKGWQLGGLWVAISHGGRLCAPMMSCAIATPSFHTAPSHLKRASAAAVDTMPIPQCHDGVSSLSLSLSLSLCLSVCLSVCDV
jgi:hypothetical protein